MTIDQIITAVGLVGIGGLLKAGFDYLIATRKAKQDSKQEFKEKRYKAIILLCYALVHYDKEGTNLTINRPDISSLDRLKNEVSAEFLNMSLFASDKVILKMADFIKNKDVSNLNSLALAMRKDLYGIRTRLRNDVFDLRVD